MNSNVLRAIINIINNPVAKLKQFYNSRNRINNVGEALENYIKDLFAGTIGEFDEQKRMDKFCNIFSYQGNQNNPPDMILKNGDAIEVKKIEGKNSSIALNSSYPKSKLYSNSSMITSACKNCESWTEKDILYAVGVMNNDTLKQLFFCYGVDYAASADIYRRIKHVIQNGVNDISDVEFAKTNEIARINRVDPLGITYLRIRGMWGIENPFRVFSYVLPNSNSNFEFCSIINTEKYNSYPLSDRIEFENLINDNVSISDIRIKNPDNPNILKSAKLIRVVR